MKYLIMFIITLSGILYSCNRNAVDGEDTPPKFRPDMVVFDSGEHTTRIKSLNNQDWTFNNFIVIDSTGTYDNPSLEYEYQEGKEHKIWNVAAVKASWFTLRKIDERTIEIHVKPATENRKFSFDAYRGNSWQRITVIQYKDAD